MCASQYLSYRRATGVKSWTQRRSNRSGPHLRNQQSLVHCLPLCTAMIITISLGKAPAEAEEVGERRGAPRVAEAAHAQNLSL